MDNKQIDSKLILLNFNNSGISEVTINVPFLVTDILFRPPISDLSANIAQQFVVTSTLVGGGCQTMSGYSSITFANDFRYRFQKPILIRGSYTFTFIRISNGAQANFTGGIAFPIEFIGYNQQ
jgi:hypothetical protein